MQTINKNICVQPHAVSKVALAWLQKPATTLKTETKTKTKLKSKSTPLLKLKLKLKVIRHLY